MKIAVLMGGTSAERDVSLASGLAVARALKNCGHEVLALDCAYADCRVDFQAAGEAKIVQETPADLRDREQELNRNLLSVVELLLREKVEVVFNALHGGYGENGQLQAVLELNSIPFTGSGSLASALGMDKHLSKILFQGSLVPTADWLRITDAAQVDRHKVAALGMPLVVKPNEQGSTVGLSIVRSFQEIDAALERAFHYGRTVLIETYIPGRELTVAVLGSEVLPVIEIIPRSGFYDYEAKYQSGKTTYQVPADLPAALAEDIQAAALRAFSALNCRGYGRIDFRLREDGKFFCLEVNTLPGMTATSLVPKAARAVGIEFDQLVQRIVSLACE